MGSTSSTDEESRADSRGSGGPTPKRDTLAEVEYFQQPRFASGQLFVGTVITSLVVNTFYNPSLSELVHCMIASNVYTSLVPMEWVGKSYSEYFDHLLWQEERLAVGLLRRADPEKVNTRKSVAFGMR